MAVDAETKPSEAIAFIQRVWDHVMHKRSLSWRRTNPALRSALELAIDADMKFAPGDFDYMMSRFNGGYWIGADPEWVYSYAIAHKHTSCCRSFEAWKKRGPFIFRDGERMHVGKEFHWYPAGNKQFTVTSFRPDGLAITACSYRERGVIESRITIMLDELKADREHALDEKLVRDFFAESPRPYDEVRARIFEGIETTKDAGPEVWKVAADRVRAYITEMDTPDPSMPLTDEQDRFLLRALGLSRPFRKNRSYRNEIHCSDDSEGSVCGLLSMMGCVVCKPGSGYWMVTDVGVKALGAGRFIGQNVTVPIYSGQPYKAS